MNARAIPCVPAVLCMLLAGCAGTHRAPAPEREAGPGASVPAPAPAAAPAGPTARTQASAPPPAPAPRGGGFYKDDGPGEGAPTNLAAIPDAEPRLEPLHRFANNPYNVFGVDYVPMRELVPFRQRGLGSWYGRKFHGQRTSSGEPYDMFGMTAAHPTLPIPSYVRVTSVASGASVLVRVNDRGPFHPGRVIDLSWTAAAKLGYVNQGSALVEVELVDPQQMPTVVAAQRAARTAAEPAALAASGPDAGQARTRALEAPRPAESRPLPASAVPAPPPTAAAAAAPSPPTATASLPVSNEAGGVFLQLGAFSARDNAESFRARIYQQLSWLNQGIDVLARDGLFRLHLGPYRDRAEAAGMAERIREALDLKPVVVVR